MKRINLIIFTILLFLFNLNNIFALNSNLILDGYPRFNCAGTTLPSIFPQITNIVITIIQIAVPIIIVITGMLDFVKGVIAQKEDEFKKGRQTFVKRLVLGALVYIIFAIVRTIIGLVAPNDSSMWNCVDCFINGCDAIK